MPPKVKYSFAGTLASFWGLLAVFIVLADAATRLSRHIFDAWSYDWSILQWTVFIVNVGFMAFAEGYRGFQQSFVPRTVARAMYLRKNPTAVRGLLAPLFCVGYFGAPKRTQKVIWIGTVLIVVAVILIRQVPQPWRGIADAGVVIGLSWGCVALVLIGYRAISSGQAPVAHQVPDQVVT